MALANYSDLATSLASWMKRADLTASIPDFVTLLEARVSRDLRLRQMLTTVTLTTVAGERSVTLPVDFLEFDSVVLVRNPNRVLTYVTNETIDSRFPENSVSSSPEVFTLVGDKIEFGPVPDAAYDISVIYYKKFDALETAGTNWLMTNHPSIYLFGSLVEASTFGLEDSRAAMWETRFKSDMDALKVSDEKSNWSGSALRVRTVV
jgi:hypothetical protein